MKVSIIIRGSVVKQTYLQSTEETLMKWILPFFIVSLIFGFIAMFFTHPSGSFLLHAYLTLIGSLLVLSIIALILYRYSFHNIASYLTLLISIIGVWAPILFSEQTGYQDIFLLLFLVLPILYSSVVFPLAFTVTYTLVQFVFIFIVVLVSIHLTPLDKVNILFFLALVSFFSILTNYLNKLKNKEFHEESVLDELTGLFNRRYFNVMMHDLIAKRASTNSSFGLIMADIDNFKSYNDTYGHPVGDVILKNIAKSLAKEVGVTNMVCRYGGDEFVIIISDFSKEGIFEVAKNLQTSVGEIDYSFLHTNITQVTLTMGLAMYPLNGSTFEEIIDFADNKLIEAKQLGKNRVAY